jgi:ATP-dependent exoDNAse (exonuclease V) beta subunit
VTRARQDATQPSRFAILPKDATDEDFQRFADFLNGEGEFAGFVPKDAAVRSEITVRVGDNMCVEAGAGTGKTTVLVDRIVRIIESGHAKAHELAVITFTEKAAAELAGRVRQKLEDARAAATPGSQEHGRLDDAIRDLNRAHIETIHAFASALLRERPVEASLDPGFQVLEGLAGDLDFEAAYSDWTAAEMNAEQPSPALVDALNLGLDPKCIREAAVALNTHRDLLPLPEYPTHDPDIDGLIAKLGVEADVLKGLAPCAMDRSDGAFEQLNVALEIIDQVEQLSAHTASLRHAIATAQPLKTNAGNQGNWREKDDCRQVKASLTRIAKALKYSSDAMKTAATAALISWLQGFVRQYEEQRKQAGKASFDDLLIWARDLVRDNREVRAYFQQKFACILVDEFQDTDPLQVELIIYLCEDGANAADWRDAKLRLGSLFVVGDPKQSIYRFRRADIATYDEVKQRIFGGEVRRIVQNFRSASPIIDFVNTTFDAIFQPAQGVQPEYIPLEHHPNYEAARNDALTIVKGEVTSSGDRTTATDIRRGEATALASLIRQAVEDRAWPLRGGRAAQYRDIAILVQTRTELEYYEDALARADVPYRHEGGRTFFLRQEVRELVAVLRALDDPTDGIAAVAALRSAAFGISDEDLLLHRSNVGRFDYLSVRNDAEGVVPDGLRVLRRLALMRHTHPLPEIVRAVLDELCLVEFAMLQPQGEQVAANLLKVIDQSRAFVDAGGAGLRGFVRWLKDNIAHTSDETDAPISEETDDVVRIVTIHASKGLEFPVVVFANMNTIRADRTKTIGDRRSRRLEIKLGKKDDGFRTPGFDDAHDLEHRHDEAEEQRLLYVAATRAKDRLVIPFFSTGERPRKEKKSLIDWLRAAHAHDEPTLDASALPPITADPPIWQRPLDAANPQEIEHVREVRAEWRSSHTSLIARAATPLDVRTASALKDGVEHLPPSDDSVRRGRAVDFGSAVHALLERIDLRRPQLVESMSTAIAAEFGMPERQADIARVATNALESNLIARALRSQRVLREAPFVAPLPSADGSGVTEGRVDLLFVEDGGIVVVDFKTDAVRAADVDARTAEYRGQALIYAWAAHRATGFPVREVIFLFASIPAEKSIPVDAAFLAEAEAMLSTPQ